MLTSHPTVLPKLPPWNVYPPHMPRKTSMRATGSTWRALVLASLSALGGCSSVDEPRTATLLRRPFRDLLDPGRIPIDHGPGVSRPSEQETVPNAPTHLGVGLRTTRRAEIGWIDQSEVEDGYRIERRLADLGDDWIEVGTVGPVTNLGGRFVDGPGAVFGSGPRSGTRYCYRVIPFNELGSPDVVPVRCVRLNVDLKETNLDEVVIQPGSQHGWGQYAIPDLKGFDEAVLVFETAGLLPELAAVGPGQEDLEVGWEGRKLVYVADEAVINLSNQGPIELPGNLTLMSGRRGVVEGALIIKNFVSYAD
ncbi:MAG: fibronectin type III domain-containing protein, partial [bacterium]|nr:fibronectin type III domain-containing protein [bacterium]